MRPSPHRQSEGSDRSRAGKLRYESSTQLRSALSKNIPAKGRAEYRSVPPLPPSRRIDKKGTPSRRTAGPSAPGFHYLRVGRKTMTPPVEPKECGKQVPTADAFLVMQDRRRSGATCGYCPKAMRLHQKKSPCFQGLFPNQNLKPRSASISPAIPQESDPAAPAPGPSPPRQYKPEPE